MCVLNEMLVRPAGNAVQKPRHPCVRSRNLAGAGTKMGRDQGSPKPQILGPKNKGRGAENDLLPPPSTGELVDGPC